MTIVASQERLRRQWIYARCRQSVGAPKRDRTGTYRVRACVYVHQNPILMVQGSQDFIASQLKFSATELALQSFPQRQYNKHRSTQSVPPGQHRYVCVIKVVSLSRFAKFVRLC